MDFWQKARSFAEEAAKRSQELTMEAARRSSELTIGSAKLGDIVTQASRRSQELTKEAARRSSELTIGSTKLGDIVTEASKRSKEIAAEASKRAEQIRAEAAKRADLIKSSLSDGIVPVDTQQEGEKDLEKFGVTEELREFIKEITASTFQDFPLQDDSPISDVPTASNVSQDLTEWQVKHCSLVLSTVKEISKLRYELCPRVMKERKFWRIYFMLVNSHVAPHEKQYMEEKQKSAEQANDKNVKEPSNVEMASKHEAKIKTSTSSTEQDLDVFLLGGDSDEGPEDGDGDGGLDDDDFDKIADLSDVEKGKL
ncbi:hypothetical protein SLEP1_g34648 [Rubroshorea leprosula]|uniref:BSD domain-containing protein n=1 Tax=Rubroshorea leprosula TaxID=152421 RepID=A0AAV5KKN4_9ROSI|nr:hypothetical protein SLEP1_g34648 [Rubroshorea leprosula]